MTSVQYLQYNQLQNNLKLFLQISLLFFRQVDGTAPTFVTKPSIRQNADDTTTLVFHCSIYADPKPVVTWFHNGDKVQDNKKFQVWPFFLFAQNLLWFNTLLAAIYQQRNLRKLEPKVVYHPMLSLKHIFSIYRVF